MTRRPPPVSLRGAFTAFAFALGLQPALGRAAGPAPLGDEFLVNQVTDAIQQSSAVALSASGDFVVVWQSEVAGSGDEIRARRFDARGAALGAEIAVNTVSAGNQNLPSVALDAGGDFVVAWQSLVASNFEIRARRFDGQGVALGEEIAVNEPTGETHGSPVVAIGRKGDFVVAWESSRNGSFEIRARRFDARGLALGEELAINAVTASSQRAPAIAMDGSGDFIVAWRSNVGGSFEIRARRFKAGGEPKGAEIAVHAMTAGDQLAPAVAMSARGAFVVAWENAGDNSFEIRARRFTASGAAQGEEKALDPQNAGEQFAPAVAMDAGGDFVVTWHRKVEGNYEIRARGFAANGAPQSDELAVNTVSQGNQKAAAIAMDTGGNFIVTWHSDASGSWEISARRYRRWRPRGHSS